MTENRIDHVIDANSGLEGRLTILRGSDSGAAAVMVELSNPSQENDVILKVNSDMSAFIMLTVTDAQGYVLSQPARKFSTEEVQQFSLERIRRAETHRWRAPLSAQLDAARLGTQAQPGRLVVNVALLYQVVKSGAQPAGDEFATALLTLYDMDVLFTPAALREGSRPVDPSSR